MFVYSCSVKIHAWGFDELLESIFCFLWKHFADAWRSGSQLARDQVNMVVMEKNWALSVDQCWLQAFQFSVHLINSLSILPRYNNFTEIQKLSQVKRAADHQTVTMTCFWCKFDFGKGFGVSLWSNHWACCCQLLYKSHFSSHITQPMLHKLNELGYKTLPHPPYSPDLSLTNYHFFKHLDNFLQGKCFHNQHEAENSFQEFIKSQSTDFYATGINKHFLLAKTCWLEWFLFWLIKMCLNLVIVI